MEMCLNSEDHGMLLSTEETSLEPTSPHTTPDPYHNSDPVRNADPNPDPDFEEMTNSASQSGDEVVLNPSVVTVTVTVTLTL